MNIRTLAERSKMPGVEKIIEQALAGIPTNATTLEDDDRVLLVYAYPIYDENQVITGSLGIVKILQKLRNCATSYIASIACTLLDKWRQASHTKSEIR